MGEALRKIMKSHSHTKLVQEIKDHLKKGYTVPDELAIQALEVCLLEPQCVSRGYVEVTAQHTLEKRILFDRLLCNVQIIEA